MQGVLLVDKPAEWTSFDVVNYVRKMVAQAEDKRPKQIKVGHTGTLDPFATGLLVLLIGKEYTKKAGEFAKQDKTYEVTMRLGQSSSTGDPEGEITQTAVSGTAPTEEALQQALQRFKGVIQQVPPAYSAVKVNGRRAYKLAREGKAVEIEPRQVTINRLELTDYHYPEAQLIADVSSGTYIRSLVADIGEAVGTSAYTTALRRTAAGDFSLQNAVSLQGLDIEKLKSYLIA
jgi:tRNA pseudouridine55 synthase